MSQPEANSATRGRSRREGGKPTLYRPSRDEKEKYTGYRPRNSKANTETSTPTILLKSRTNDTRSLSPVRNVPTNDSKEVPKAPAKVLEAGSMAEPVKLLSEDLTFQDSLHDFLSDNPDFLVVGCVGLQWSGKSSILSHLASSNCSEFVNETKFHICHAEDQNRGLTGTFGLDAYVSSDRIIWIDCQPLLSPALAERELANSYSKESYKEKYDNTCIGTQIEVQSLQVLTFLYSVCHVLMVVQDSLADSNLIRLLQTAEMLKPNLTNDDSESDHMPHLIMVYNRAEPSDLIPKALKQAWSFHDLAFKKSRLQIHSSHFNDSGINYAALLDWNVTDDLCVKYRDAIPALKRSLLALPKFSIGPSNLTEKTWFLYASKAWDAVRKSTLMMEYARLLP